MMWQIAIAGLIFGTAYALFLEFHPFGDFLAKQRTWLSVVVGVGGCLLIARWRIPAENWNVIFISFLTAGLPIIIRSLRHEQRDWRDTVREIREVFEIDE
jgi:hypothetical protein